MRYRTNQKSILLQVIFLVFLPCLLFPESVYFYDAFNGLTGVQSNWWCNFRYGRNGVYIPITNGWGGHPARTSRIEVINNQACLTGAVQSHWEYGTGGDTNDWYISYWCGNTIKLTNAGGLSSFTASETNPFGYEVIRTWACLDSDNEGMWSPDNIACAVEGSIWLAVDNGISGTMQGQTFDDAVSLYEMFRYGVNTNASLGGFRSQWGYYVSSENRFNLASVPYSGGTLDLVNNATYGLEKNYDDLWAGNANPNNSNSNPVGLKITHDGSRLKFYINPNPKNTAGNPFPNEYCLVGEKTVGWNSGMRIMLGHGSHWHMTEREDVRYDDLLIRSVADTIRSEIYPAEAATNKTVDFVYLIKPSFRRTDSGIGEIRIRKPSNYASAWSNIEVYSEWGDSANDNSVAQLINIYSGTPAARNQVLVKTNGSELYLRFCQVSDSLHAVINSNTRNNQIEIKFRLRTPAIASPSGDTFIAYASCVKYSNTAFSSNSTTADKKFLSGNATATSYALPAIQPDYDTQTVKAYAEPSAFAGITPNQLYQGLADFSFTYTVITSTTNPGPDIDRLFIAVPSGFGISNITSLKIASSAYIKLTNINSTNNIRLDYAGAGAQIPAKGGIDIIGIRIKSTPAVGNYLWRVRLQSDISGTGEQVAVTNGVYRSQTTAVIPPPPDVTAYETAIDDKIYSSTSSNVYNYYLVNNGASENKVRRARIVLPSVFSRVTNFSSLIVPAGRIRLTNSSLIVDYSAEGTNIPSSSFDRIQFTAWDRVSPISVSNVSLPAFADNFNGEGYHSCSEGAQTWDISFAIPPAAGQSSVKTNTVRAVWTTNQYYYKIYNAGSTSNEIYKARIMIPSLFTDITIQNSVKAVGYSVSNRVIRLDYQPVQLKPGELDIITFKMKTMVLFETNVELPCLVYNTPGTNEYRFTGAYGVESRFIDTVYPPAEGEAYAEVEGDSTPPLIIDASTETNSLVYYIKNSGEPGNQVRRARIYMPKAVVSNVLSVQSTNIAQDALNISWIDDGPGYRLIYLDYEADGNVLEGGGTDIISFRMVDKITGFTNFNMISTITNILEMKTNSNVAGKTQNIRIQIPPADAAGRILPNVLFTSPQTVTNLFVYKVTNRGRGSNKIQRLLITNRSSLNLSVVRASNTYYTGSAGITNRGNAVLINYATAGFPVLAGGVDYIYLYIQNSISAITNALWDLRVDNFDGNSFVSTVTMAGTSKMIYTTEKAGTIIEPGQIYTTATQSSFVYTIKNGQSGGRLVKRARILIPVPIFITNKMSYDSFQWGGAVESRSNNAVIVVYPVPLDAGQSDKISLSVKDAFTEGQTNVEWKAEVDYGDGYGWRSTAPDKPDTNVVRIILPPAQALAGVSPVSIGVDYIDSSFSLTVTNNGIPGNNISLVRITAPSFFTNISMVTSSLISTNAELAGPVILLRYHLFSTNLKVGKKDVIRFTGYDSATNATAGSFLVEAGNTTNFASLNPAGVIPGRSLTVSIFQPNYAAEGYITPNAADTTAATNTFVYNIRNTGSLGNDITYLDIFLPGIFVTNNLSASSIKAGAITKFSDRIRFDYTAGTNIQYLRSDTITLSVVDTFIQGATNVLWQSKARYTTSGLNYIDVAVPDIAGQTNEVAFRMSVPRASVNLSPDEIYTTSRTNSFMCAVRNEGRGSNKILNLRMTIPSVFTQGLKRSDLGSRLAIQTNYENGVLLFRYNNFNTGSTDWITMTLPNSQTNSGSYPFPAMASNFGNSSNAYGFSTLSVVTPPSCSISPNVAESTVRSNRFTFYIKQDGTGVSSVKKAVILIPAFYTNVRSIISSRATNVVNNTSSLTLFYNNFPSGQFDQVQFTVLDTIENGFTNVLWENCLVDNGTGFVRSRVTSGLSLNVFYSNPPALARSHVVSKSNNKIYVNEVTNTCKVVIENTGTGNNSIRRAVILVPDAFTNFSLAASSHLAGDSTNIRRGPSSITLCYQPDPGGLLDAGETDDVSILGYDRVTFNTDVYFSVLVDNSDGKGYVSAPVKPGKSLKVSFIFEPNTILAYILSKPNVLYTVYSNFSMNYNGSPLEYKIENLSYVSQIQRIRLDFNSSFFTNIPGFAFFTNKLSVQSRILTNERTSITITATNLIIDYSLEGTGIPPNGNDVIEINGYYIVTNTNVMFIEAVARYSPAGSDQVTFVPQGETKQLVISRPAWGVLYGRVYPEGNNVTINLYPEGSAVAARSITYTTANDREYKIDRIPEGVYRFEFSSGEYLTQSYGLDNISVLRNNIQIDLANKKIVYQHVFDVLLKNKALNSKELSSQIRKCKSLDDGGRTRFIAPVSTIFEDFFLEISKQSISSVQAAALSKNKCLIPAGSPEKISVYLFDIEDLRQQDLEFNKLKTECQIVLYYDKALIASLGWSEDHLGIIYWDPGSRDWVIVGGLVDKEASTVTAQIRYLYREYALTGMVKGEGKIYNVKVGNNPFTPLSGNIYSEAPISFMLEESLDRVELSIFNIQGEKIRSYSLNGMNRQCTQAWDGKDESGKLVRGGMYLFQIKAGSEIYSGAILLVK